MPRTAAVALENDFKRGLITEASGLNFPENACTDTDNCSFQFEGSVTRRRGFDFEDNFVTKNIDRANVAINSYLWKNVAGDGNLTVYVVQVGSTLYFYKANGANLSSGAIVDTVTLTPVSGAPTTASVEAQFADGNGLLFVTHPYIDPLRISYNTTTDTVTETSITIQIRDFEGAIADTLAITDRPVSNLASLTVSHHYNLLNQGWTTANLTIWDGAQTYMPSNADVMWRFKDSNNAFTALTVNIDKITAGNTAAPKGHFILPLANQNRDTASGLTGVAATTTGFQRPSTSAWFAGRVFYAGINSVGFNSKIYFTQIVERDEQYGFAYQVNDPTAETLFDLLPSDGGVINIPEAGTVYKLFTVPGGIAVFAANGVWFITGSTGLGFIATDYTVQKIAHIPSISGTSFVDVQGFPSWWNLEGIYIMTSEGGGLPKVQSLTDASIKSYYDAIPDISKKYSRGFYHNIDQRIAWIFRSEATTQLTEQYEFDRVLNLNTRTGGFYPWSVSDGEPKIHAITVTDAVSGSVSIEDVIDGSSNNVIDASANQVIAFALGGATSAPTEKYLTSFPAGATYSFTFSETKNADYIDWFQHDAAGVNYTSYFTSGYRLRGEAIKKFQPTWVQIYSDTQENTAYQFRAKWNFANVETTKRWSTQQTVTHTNTDYDYGSKRLKVRGHGLALQFHVDSVDGSNFNIIGWAEFLTGNQLP